VGTNLRILLGAGQVLSLLSGVLEIVYPPNATTGLRYAVPQPSAVLTHGQIFTIDWQFCIAHGRRHWIAREL
jgi:hypothetical protein